MPTVSVIVPNYNHAKFLRQRIETILAQAYQDFELILLDDCSKDESREILREYAGDRRVRIEFNEVNSGTGYKQWNKGVRMAQGKYVWIAESDDYAEPRLLERLVRVLEEDRGIVYAYCRSWCVTDEKIDGYVRFGDDAQNPRWDNDFCADGREEFANYFAWYNPVRNASAVVFRKNAYERVGGADESYRLSGDWKLWATMALAGKVAYVCEPLNYQRFHGANTQMNTNIATTVWEILEIARLLHERVRPSEEVLGKFQKWTASLWISAVLSLHTPSRYRWSMIRNGIAIYPHPFRGVPKAALDVLNLKIQRHWRALHAGANH